MFRSSSLGGSLISEFTASSFRLILFAGKNKCDLSFNFYHIKLIN